MLVAAFTSSGAFAGRNVGSKLCEVHLREASSAEEIPLGLLYAVALTETGAGGQLNPYAMNVEGASFLAKTSDEAMAVFQEARDADKKLIDLGCMQINYYYHHRNFASVPDMLDPRQNVVYAAKLLKSLRVRHGSWTEAVARYHAGPKNKTAQHRYVCKVLQNLVSTQFGNWTPESKSYCNQRLD